MQNKTVLLQEVINQASNYQELLPEETLHLEQALFNAEDNPLFRHLPSLATLLPCAPLGSLPTPITKIHEHFYVKNDGLQGSNKARKLRYLLAQAQAQKAQSVIAFGCVGSNQTAQTAIFCKELGLQAVCFLRDQKKSDIVEQNLLIQLACNAQIIYGKNREEQQQQAFAFCQEELANKRPLPFILAVGGSTALGTLGAVEAAFELKEQIDAGILPCPARIYLPLGSGGTAAGLILGCKLAQLPTQIIPVLIEPEDVAGTMEKKMRALVHATEKLLRSLVPSLPELTITPQDYRINKDFCGPDYAMSTPESLKAKNFLSNYGFYLDDTYSAKCCAAVCAELNSPDYDNKPILFWNTHQQGQYEKLIASVKYKDLPEQLHKYF